MYPVKTKLCKHFTGFPAETRDLIDRLLDNGIKHREVARLTGASKSSVHRHQTSCWRIGRAMRLAERKRGKDIRIVIEWPDAPLKESDLRPDDIVISVVYAPAYAPPLPQPAPEPDPLLAPREPEG